MPKQTTLFLVLFLVTSVFAIQLQGNIFFTNLVWAEDDLAPKTVTQPSSAESADTRPRSDSRASATSVRDTNPTPAERVNNERRQVESVTISTPTFTTRGTNPNTQSSDTGSTSARNTNERPATAAATTNPNTQSKKEAKKETKKDTKSGTAYVAPISGSLQVTTTAQNAERVEYYSQSKQSDTETYLGAGQSTSSGEWSLDIDAANRLPNGEYDVSAKAKRKDGSVVQSQSAQLNVAIPENRISQVEKAKFENSKEDTDGDGVSDKEEIRLGANPESADTDKDGFLDGDEIKNGFDPLKFSVGDKSDKIVFESPKEVIANTATEPETKKVSDKRFKVDKVELVKTANDGGKATRFSGKALPNMFITLYIYSDPIIVTVKTDAEGNWTYDLDKELPDGDHEIFVAVTDNVGKISAQSEALPFVKTAQAVAIKPAAAAAAEALQNASPLERSRTEFIIMAIVIALSFLGIALAVIGRRSSVI
ncbi:MAG: Ig-like domain-containing protein [bacterium]|nr:Ig-like domain-containing protein [bacterium]